MKRMMIVAIAALILAGPAFMRDETNPVSMSDSAGAVLAQTVDGTTTGPWSNTPFSG